MRFIIHYLDDFLLIGPPGCDDCAVALAILLQTFDLLGLPVAWEKLEGPTACLTFLSLEIDSAALELRLPQEKLWELQQTVASWLDRTDCRKKELESLHGQLAYASKVVKPGKTFTRRLIELLAVFESHIIRFTLFHGTARNGMAYSVALFSGTERLKCLDISLNHFQTLYYVTFVTNKTSLLFLVADN